MATWAKGINFKNANNTSTIGGVGIYGDSGTAQKVYLGLGADPWNNKGLEVTSSTLKFKGTDVSLSNHTHSYLPLSGGTLTGNLICNRNIEVNGSGYNFIAPNNYGYMGRDTSGSAHYMLWMNTNNQVNLGYSNRQIKIDCDNPIQRSGHALYHAGNKPTANDIGAAPSNHKHSLIASTHVSPHLYHYDKGVLIDFGIAQASTSMISIRVTGNGYSSGVIDATYSFYDYTANDGIINYKGHCDDIAMTLTVFRHDGKLKAWLKQISSYHTLIIEITSGTKGADTFTPTYTNADMPTTGVSHKVDIVPTRNYSTKHKPSLSDLGAASASHTHSYLSTGGGTLTGNLLLGGEVSPNSSAKLQVKGFMRTGNIYLHEGGNTPNSSDGAIENVGGMLKWKGYQVYTALHKPSASDIGAAASSHNHTSLTGVTNIAGAGSSTNWGSLDISGSKGSWQGIHFKDYGYVWMVRNDGYTGMWKAGKSAVFAFDQNGALVTGSVPWSRLSSVPSSFTPSSHTHNHLELNNTETKNVGRMQVFQLANNSTLMPDTGWWSLIRFQHAGYANGYWQEIATSFSGDSVRFRRNVNGSLSAWKSFAFTDSSISGNAGSATRLQNARSINGTNFDGQGNITTANWGTARTITIGNTGKSVNGSGNVSWTVSEIGARPSNWVPTWNDISGKPSSFYTHPNDANTRHVTDSEKNTWNGKANSSGTYASLKVGMLEVKDIRDTAPTPDSLASRQVIPFFNNHSTYGGGWKSGITIGGWTSGYQVWQLSSGSTTADEERLYYRRGRGSTWGSLRRVYHEGDKPDWIELKGNQIIKYDTLVNGSWNIDQNLFKNGMCIELFIFNKKEISQVGFNLNDGALLKDGWHVGAGAYMKFELVKTINKMVVHSVMSSTIKGNSDVGSQRHDGYTWQVNASTANKFGFSCANSSHMMEGVVIKISYY